MKWTVLYKKTFLKKLAKLPPKIRKRVEDQVFDDIPDLSNPYSDSKLENLEGYDIYYKLRFGDYRVGLKLDKKTKTIEFCRVLHRRDIYKYFP